MELHLDRDLPIGLGEQLQAQIRLLVDAGVLAPGDGLPPARTLAEREGVNVNTVAAAYAALEAEGYLEQRKRAGTRVAPSPPVAAQGALLAALGREVATRARALGLPADDVLRSVAAQSAMGAVAPRFRVALLAGNTFQAEELHARARVVFADEVELTVATPAEYDPTAAHLTVVHPALTERLLPTATAAPHHLDFGTDYPAPAD
ncbi:MAG: GntR family transcriptional regulator [Deinococcales bacterium]